MIGRTFEEWLVVGVLCCMILAGGGMAIWGYVKGREDVATVTAPVIAAQDGTVAAGKASITVRDKINTAETAWREAAEGLAIAAKEYAPDDQTPIDPAGAAEHARAVCRVRLQWAPQDRCRADTGVP